MAYHASSQLPTYKSGADRDRGALIKVIALMLGIALPVNRFDFSPVNNSTKPKFLIHGERDELVSARDIRKFYGGLREPRELAVIDGADHLFDGKTPELGDTVDDLLRDWNAWRTQ